MAACQKEQEEQSEPGQFCCSVCLELLKDPVGIPCGHSYCKVCIEGFWDQNEEKGNCTCPQCRETFNPRPVLRRNNMLAEAVEMFRRQSTQQTPPSLPEVVIADVASSGPAGVYCDFCSETDPSKATMSCLTCVASFCPVHLEPHHSVPVLRKHHLVSATVPLQEKMCTKHNKLMEVYCRTDKKCICYLCVMDEHNGHQTVSTAAEREEQQEQLKVNQQKVQKREKQREKELTVLLESLVDFKESGQTAVETSNKIFDEMISFLEKMRTSAEQLILAQEKTAVAQAEELQLQLEQEIAKLRQRDTELEKISRIDDLLHFIQTFQSLSVSCESPDLSNDLGVRSKPTFRKVTDLLLKLKDDVEFLFKQTWPSIESTMSTVNVLRQPGPQTREELLCYSCPLKLDESAASKNMILSQEQLRATCKTEQKYYFSDGNVKQLSKAERITDTEQMWCCEALADQCYWEVTVKGFTWCAAVSYKDKNKTPSYHSEFGQDDRSWSLERSRSGCFFRHNNQSSKVSVPGFSGIGVYLDYSEGVLAFYGIAGSRMFLLHRVETTFTEPLYPCIGFKDDGSKDGKTYYAELVKLW